MFSAVIIFKRGLNTCEFCGVLNGISQQCSCWSFTKQREAAFRTFFDDLLPEMLSENVTKETLCLYIVFRAKENYLIEGKSASDYSGSKL